MRWAAIALAIGSVAATGAALPPPSLAPMRIGLAQAAASHDRARVATFLVFPLALDNYGSPPRVSRSDFLEGGRYFTMIFGGGDRDLLKCVETGPLTWQADAKQFGGLAWVADCNGNDYFFARRKGAWRLIAYQNINE